ncbi:hypothetical protein NEAUS04_0685 [Nematocida ausubeli]|nr:hypothetical protein NEAUS05_0999 [Nematocida ausubeli]KAI5161726.1 hypothetical protein NEAUS04_0685 [Nematocida ausubeli]
MERPHKLLFTHKEHLIGQIEGALGKKVLLRRSTDGLITVNTEELHVCTLSDVPKEFLDNVFLVSVCTELINQNEYQHLFISWSIEDEYSLYFILFMEKFCRYRNIKIHCSYSIEKEFMPIKNSMAKNW